MFKKQKTEAQAPSLQGEDFDMYPDLGDRPGNRPQPAAYAGEPEEDDEPGPTELQKKIAAIPEKKWKLYQLFVGILLGFACGALITFGDRIFSGSIGIILAFGVAVVLPNVAERQFARKVPRLRLAMCISLLVWIVAALLIGLAADNALANGVQ